MMWRHDPASNEPVWQYQQGKELYTWHESDRNDPTAKCKTL
jgi:hypothetical protein